MTDFDVNPTGGRDPLDVSAFGIPAATFASRVTLTDLGADIQATIGGDTSHSVRPTNAQTLSNITTRDFLI